MKDDFIGRETQLKALQSKFDAKGFHMAVVYGRRRVGKTALLNKFIEVNKVSAVSFVAVEQREKALIEMMGLAVMQELSPELAGSVSFDSFEKIFDFLTKAAKDRKVIFLIDEYPYLAKECTYISSLLQKYIDHDWKKTNLFLILCGSLVSFMSDEVIGKNAPLYGRSDLELKLQPFDYYESGLFFPKYKNEDKATVYGLTGGVAAYLKQFDRAKSLDDNIAEQFFSDSGYFSAELIKMVITGDRLNPTAYNSILSAVAAGHTRYNEIADVTGIDNLQYYLNMLIESELMEKRKSKRAYYVIADPMVRFWFSYVDKAASIINAGKGMRYYADFVKPHLRQHMGCVFEEMSKQYIFRNIYTEKVKTVLTDIVTYTDSIKTPEGLKQIEIDLLGLNGQKNVLAGECKFKKEPFDKEAYENFLEKVKYIGGENLSLMLFSLSGFTKYVKAHAGNISLVDISGMYR